MWHTIICKGLKKSPLIGDYILLVKKTLKISIPYSWIINRKDWNMLIVVHRNILVFPLDFLKQFAPALFLRSELALLPFQLMAPHLRQRTQAAPQ